MGQASKIQSLQFLLFVEFVYFWTFAGKIQSFHFFQIFVNLFIFGLFPEKIRVFSFSVSYLSRFKSWQFVKISCLSWFSSRFSLSSRYQIRNSMLIEDIEIQVDQTSGLH